LKQEKNTRYPVGMGMCQKLYIVGFGDMDEDVDEFLLWRWGWDRDTRIYPVPLSSLLSSP